MQDFKDGLGSRVRGFGFSAGVSGFGEKVNTFGVAGLRVSDIGFGARMRSSC